MVQVYPALRKTFFSVPTRKMHDKTKKALKDELEENSTSLTEQHMDAIKNITKNDNIVVIPIRNAKDENRYGYRFSDHLFNENVISAKWENINFEITTSVEFEDNNKSIKNWTHIFVNNGVDHDPRKIRELNLIQDQIAASCCEISYNNLDTLIKKKQRKPTEIAGYMTALTYGVSDPELGEYLSRFWDKDLGMKDHFKDKDAKDCISGYYKSLFGENKKNLMKNLNKHNFWMTCDVSVVNEENYFEGFHVLQKVKYINNNNIAIFGLGFENSQDKDLAKISSKSIAHEFAYHI